MNIYPGRHIHPDGSPLTVQFANNSLLLDVLSVHVASKDLLVGFSRSVDVLAKHDPTEVPPGN